MFRTVTLSIIRCFSLYTQQWCMSYRFCWQLASSIRKEPPDPARKLPAKPVWHTPLLCVQWKTPDDGQSNCPKHVEFYSKNKFEKLVHLVGFSVRIYHDAWSPESQTVKVRMHIETTANAIYSCMIETENNWTNTKLDGIGSRFNMHSHFYC